MKDSLLRYSFILFCVVVFAACNSKKQETESGMVKIVATTGMIGDAIKNIVGDSAELITLMGSGVDPHLYKVTHKDIVQLQEADIIVYNGLHLEGKMSEVLEQLSDEKMVIAMSDGLKASQLRKAKEFQGTYDPHIWFSVNVWKDAVAALGEKISKANGKHKTYFMANTHSYVDSLTQLHTWVKAELQSVPEDQRVLVTAHDAFGYLGDEYGVEVKGLQGLSTTAEYGLKDVLNLVDLIVDRKVKAVFVESSISDKSIKAVIEGCKDKGHEVKIGGTLYSDAMGATGTAEGTYLGMVRHNVSNIVSSLKE